MITLTITQKNMTAFDASIRDMSLTDRLSTLNSDDNEIWMTKLLSMKVVKAAVGEHNFSPLNQLGQPYIIYSLKLNFASWGIHDSNIICSFEDSMQLESTTVSVDHSAKATQYVRMSALL